MSNIAKAYGISKHGKDANITGIDFGFYHGGTLYSYVEISYIVNGKTIHEHISVDEFFEWIGEQLLTVLQVAGK